MINPYDLDYIKNHRSCADVLRENGVTLDRYGKAVCPFHGDKNKSFCFYKKTNSCHCFGCGWDGDVIRLTQAFTGLSFVEAYKYLGGTTDEPVTPAKTRKIEAYERVQKWREWIARVQDEIDRLNLAVIALDWEIRGLDVFEITDEMVELDRKKLRMMIDIENYKDTLKKLEKELADEESNRNNKG